MIDNVLKMHELGKFNGALKLINDMIEEGIQQHGTMKEFRRTDQFKWLMKHSDRIERELKEYKKSCGLDKTL